MPINAHPDYLAAEKEYLAAERLEDKIEKLKKMISLSPGHKGAENLRAQLKTRLKKFQGQLEKNKKTSKGTKTGIKKEGVQTIIIGFTNTGKSTLLDKLTNLHPKISPLNFTTKKPLVGMLKNHGIEFQLIENPAIESEYYDRGLTHTADIILLILTKIEQIEELKKTLNSEKGKQIIVFNTKENLSESEKRKLTATMDSKKYNYVILNMQDSLEQLKNKLVENSGKIRVYTKEPGKPSDKNRPIILNPESSVKDVAEKILHGFSRNIKETKIWGPSSKFSGQKVGLKHILKDLDVVEFKTR